MNKRVIALLCGTVMSFSLTGCGNKVDSNTGVVIENASIDSISKASTKLFYEQVL